RICAPNRRSRTFSRFPPAPRSPGESRGRLTLRLLLPSDMGRLDSTFPSAVSMGGLLHSNSVPLVTSIQTSGNLGTYCARRLGTEQAVPHISVPRIENLAPFKTGQK